MFGSMFWITPIVLILVPLIIALKGYTLWHSAKRNEIWWFIALLVLNTMGILEIIYVLFILKKFRTISEKETYKHEEPKV
jgi:methionyl-tRNA synthetase